MIFSTRGRDGTVKAGIQAMVRQRALVNARAEIRSFWKSELVQ